MIKYWKIKRSAIIETIAEKIKDLIEEKKDDINRNGYFVLTVNVQDSNPLIMKIEHSLKPELTNK